MSDPIPVPATAPSHQSVSVLDQAVAQVHAAYAAARPVSQAQASAAAKVLPAGSTRSVLDFDPFPFRVARAEGAYLHDVDGFTYLDLLGDYTAGLFGHDHPAIAEAVTAVLGRGWSLGAIADGEHRLAEAVCGRFPSMEQVRFTNSGTEANLMAIGLSRHHTGRDKVMAFEGAYHGGLLTFGAPSALRAPYDYVMCRYNDIDSVSEALDRHGSDIACVLIEPMMGAGGCIPAEVEFLSELRRHCTERGVLLVFDEVMTSRSSVGGAQLRLGITPDLTTLGKYLGGGMTFGAFGGSAEVMGAFDPARGGTLTHGGTFNNNALTMSVGAVAVSLLTPEILDQLFERGERLRGELTAIVTGRGLTVSGWGSILAIHATDRAITSPSDLASVDGRVGEVLFHELLARGFYIARRGFIALSLAVTDDDIERFVTTVEALVSDLEQRLVI